MPPWRRLAVNNDAPLENLDGSGTAGLNGYENVANGGIAACVAQAAQSTYSPALSNHFAGITRHGPLTVPSRTVQPRLTPHAMSCISTAVSAPNKAIRIDMPLSVRYYFRNCKYGYEHVELYQLVRVSATVAHLADRGGICAAAGPVLQRRHRPSRTHAGQVDRFADAICRGQDEFELMLATRPSPPGKGSGLVTGGGGAS